MQVAIFFLGYVIYVTYGGIAGEIGDLADKLFVVGIDVQQGAVVFGLELPQRVGQFVGRRVEQYLFVADYFDVVAVACAVFAAAGYKKQRGQQTAK